MGIRLDQVNWLLVGVVVYLIIQTAVGFHRGFIRLLASLISVLIALMVAMAIAPPASAYLQENTSLPQKIERKLAPLLGDIGTDMDTQGKEAQDAWIQALPLPGLVKDYLVEQHTGETPFSTFIRSTVAELMLLAGCFFLLFIFVYAIVRIVLGVFNVVDKMPVIRVANHWLGAVMGLGEGLIFLWVLCLILISFSHMPWAEQSFLWIEQSRILQWIYDKNILVRFLLRAAQWM